MSNTLAPAAEHVSDRRILSARFATMAYLFCNGFLFAIWGVHVPTVKAGFALNDAWLSVALLALAAGGILVMGPMGRWIGRVGTVRACLQSGVVMSVAAGAILLMPQYALLVGWLLFYGASAATNDVAANAHGAMLESRMGRPIMGSLHGSFSLGGMLGALSGSLWAVQGWPAFTHMIAAGVFCALLSAVAARYLLDEPATPVHADAPAAKALKDLPLVQRRLVGLGVLAFLALVVEGSMYDWSAIYMREIVGASPAFVSAGYAAFSVGMATGRFTGDPVRARVGNLRVLIGSCMMCVLGMGLALLVPQPVTAIVGFALAGLGLSNVVPVFFSVAGAVAVEARVAASEGIATTARLGYAGMLVGPVCIGFIAHAAGLPIALGVALLCAVAVAALAPRMLRHEPPPAH
jgi:MFS family permease